MTATAHIELAIPSNVDVAVLAGANDVNLHTVESSFSALLTLREGKVAITCPEEASTAVSLLMVDMFKAVQADQALTQQTLARLINLARGSQANSTDLRSNVVYSFKGKAIAPKTPGQNAYVEAIRSHTITFGLGPAGTGKTYLAVALALDALAKREVGRIILSRPIVEAGENLGFLPGTLTEKVDPYIRPLYDAIFEMLDADKAKRYLDTGVIEIAPLAFMRGRTLSDSFIILDEAQNTTPEQMKMFLTRLGFGSKMVVTGDATQFDIPRGASGLAGARSILGNIDDIAFVDFKESDVVRHSLVARIVAAYESASKKGNHANLH